MATKNSIDSNIPIEISKGGSNATTAATNYGTYYYTGSALAVTDTGSAGQVLTSNGSGSAPTYQTATTGGKLVFIQTQTASASSSIDFTTGLSYTNYLLVWWNYFSSVNTTQLLLQVDGGSGFQTTGYVSGIRYKAYNSDTMNNDTSTSGIIFCRGARTATTPSSGTLTIFNQGSSLYLNASGQANGGQTSTVQFSGGYYGTAITLAGLRIVSSSGDLTSGNFTLYGYNT